MLVGPSGLLRDALVPLLANAVPGAQLTAVDAAPTDETADGVPVQKTDLILIDEAMCSLDGVARLRQLTSARLALLVSRETAPDLLGLRADAYILKTEPAEAFGKIIDLVLAGTRYVSADLATDLYAETRWQQQLIDATPLTVHVLQGGRRVFVNRAVARATGVPAHVLIGRSYSELVDERQRGQLASFVEACLHGEPPSSRIKLLVHVGASRTLWLESVVCPIEFRGEPAVGLISFDITSAVDAAADFSCVLPRCCYPGHSTDQCRLCLFGFPAKSAGEPIAAMRSDADREPARPPALLEPRPSAIRSSAFERLSAQQLTVLRLIAEGRLNKQIAGELNIKETTVKGYVHRILQVMHVPNRTSAALLYRRWSRSNGGSDSDC